MRRLLATVLLTLVSSGFAACGSTDATNAVPSSTSDASTDAACPDASTIRGGGSCTGAATDCKTAVGCVQCGYQSYLKMSNTCSCVSGTWQCGISDCGPSAPGTYEDAGCLTLRPALDAAPASDASDAADGE
jgi:hypothetical protein